MTTTTIVEFPAVAYVAPTTNVVTPGQRVAVLFDTPFGEVWREFIVGSLAAFCRESNFDYAEQLACARQLGHEVFWFGACATVISAEKEPQRVATVFQFGDTVELEGVKLKITRPQWSYHHVKLEEVA